MLEKLTTNIHEKKQKSYILSELAINIAQGNFRVYMSVHVDFFHSFG